MRAYLKRFIGIGFLIVAVCSATPAQLLREFHPKKTSCCTALYGQRLADSLQDWAQLGRYYDDNQRLAQTPLQPGRVVFLGDSITDFWNLAKFFPAKPYVNRGISGQTTSQMLLRMYPDVIKLHPQIMVLLAGTNDIAGNTGPVTLSMIEDNIRAIVELAELHGIKVILCTLTPVSDYAANKMTAERPPSDIVSVNTWLLRYAGEVKAEVADYYSAVVDAQGMLREGLSNDGLHPNEDGYKLLAPVVASAIERTIRSISGEGGSPH